MGKLPSDFEFPAYIMNFPSTVSNKYPNNVHMGQEEEYNLPLAFSQWKKLHARLTREGLVYILPSIKGLQDSPYVANAGAFLPHLGDIILLANFKSAPRVGEERVARKFFESHGYQTYQPPYFFEGEAELKYLHDNLYIGGYGLRSDLEAFNWMRDKFDMDILALKMIDQRFFHLDCLLFPFDAEKALVVTAGMDQVSIKRLERYVEVIPVPEKYHDMAWTNCVRLGNTILYGSYGDKKADHEFAKILDKYNLELETFDLSEFWKSGADLSCMVFHLNYKGRGA